MGGIVIPVSDTVEIVIDVDRIVAPPAATAPPPAGPRTERNACGKGNTGT
jgi:hypothetical protein